MDKKDEEKHFSCDECGSQDLFGIASNDGREIELVCNHCDVRQEI